ncbi:MAG TPA: sigma-70 family RNA polymerase sigma factor [Gemmataceae bacterium]|nr:sigma-70 family RNA polymerase sigma factor [Gemmataceae bacterium]
MAQTADRIYRSVLVIRFQSGDRAAFEELIELFQPGLRYFLKKMLRDGHQGDDLSQEVWLDVFRGIGKLADPGAFAGWLYQIARRRAYRHLRQERHLPGSIEGIDVADKEDEDFSAEDAEKVHAALDHLPPEQCEVLLLRFIEEMSYEEIARVTASQLGTVRSRIHYAKIALRKAMERRAET